MTDEAFQSGFEQDDFLAEINHKDGRQGVKLKRSDCPKLELEKFLEDVRNGIYPLTAFTANSSTNSRTRASSPEVVESVKSASPEPTDQETRRIIDIMCNIKPQDETQNLMV